MCLATVFLCFFFVFGLNNKLAHAILGRIRKWKISRHLFAFIVVCTSTCIVGELETRNLEEQRNVTRKISNLLAALFNAKNTFLSADKKSFHGRHISWQTQTTRIRNFRLAEENQQNENRVQVLRYIKPLRKTANTYCTTLSEKR